MVRNLPPRHQPRGPAPSSLEQEGKLAHSNRRLCGRRIRMPSARSGRVPGGDKDVRLIGVEAGGRGGTALGEHAARFQSTRRRPARRTAGHLASRAAERCRSGGDPLHSVSAGLDYAKRSPRTRHAPNDIRAARSTPRPHGRRERWPQLRPSPATRGNPAGARKCPRRGRSDEDGGGPEDGSNGRESW